MCVCLSFRVCLLGVLTLIISWGSLGLELAVAAVSVTMATLRALWLCNDVISFFLLLERVCSAWMLL